MRFKNHSTVGLGRFIFCSSHYPKLALPVYWQLSLNLIAPTLMIFKQQMINYNKYFKIPIMGYWVHDVYKKAPIKFLRSNFVDKSLVVFDISASCNEFGSIKGFCGRFRQMLLPHWVFSFDINKIISKQIGSNEVSTFKTLLH